MAKGRINNDRFGNPYQVVSCKETEGKDGNMYNKGYVELGGKLYKLEVSEAQKEGVQFWVKVTKVNKNARPTSM